MKYNIQITILDKKNEYEIAKKLGIGNRNRYRDKKGYLVFFKRVSPKTESEIKAKFGNKIKIY